jgi:hypothetical protein
MCQIRRHVCRDSCLASRFTLFWRLIRSSKTLVARGRDEAREVESGRKGVGREARMGEEEGGVWRGVGIGLKGGGQ